MDSERVTEEANTTCFHPQSCSSGWGAISHLRLQRRNIDFCSWECNWAFDFTCKSLLLCCSYPGCSEPMGVEIDGCEQDEVKDSRVLYSGACCSKVVHESLSTPWDTGATETRATHLGFFHQRHGESIASNCVIVENFKFVKKKKNSIMKPAISSISSQPVSPVSFGSNPRQHLTSSINILHIFFKYKGSLI